MIRSVQAMASIATVAISTIVTPPPFPLLATYAKPRKCLKHKKSRIVDIEAAYFSRYQSPSSSLFCAFKLLLVLRS